MGLPGFLLRHQVTIEPYLGETAHGPSFGPAVSRRALVEHKRRVVLDPTGAETIASTTVYLQTGITVPLQSRVTHAGREMRALEVLDRNGGGLPTPDHVEVLCQ